MNPEILMEGRYTYIGITDKLEFSAFIGLICMRGMRGAALEDLRNIYSLFAAVMSKGSSFC